MKFKAGLKCLEPDRLRIAFEADKIWAKLGQELVITSIEDGRHMEGSKHYTGEALDLRTRYFTEEEKRKAAEELANALGSDYDVVVEGDHIHCEYDPPPFDV